MLLMLQLVTPDLAPHNSRRRSELRLGLLLVYLGFIIPVLVDGCSCDGMLGNVPCYKCQPK